MRQLLEKRPMRTPQSAIEYVRAALAEPRVSTPSARSQWERIALAPDVEVHIRRPLSREDNRRVERLLEEARRIFEEEV